MPSETPAPVSVVMITRDRRDRVLANLPRLLALPEQPDVVVVDDASADGTADAVAARFPEVTVLRQPVARGAAGRNLGALWARSPIVAFADDDSWWAPGALSLAAQLIAAYPRVGLIAGRVLVGAEGREDPINADLAAGPVDPSAPGPLVTGFLACAAVVRRRALLQSGGFHPRYGVGGEEALLATDLARAGWACVHVPAVVAHHDPAAGDPRPGRVARQLRNDLWTAWLRQPAGAAAHRSVRVLREAPSAAVAARGVLAAAAGARWVVAERAAR